MRAPLVLLLACGVAACEPAVPESGVGFEDYSTYMNRRESELSGQQTAAAPATPAAPVFSTEAIGSAINAADGTGAAAPAFPPATSTPGYAAAPFPAPDQTLSGTRPRGSAPAGIREESGEMTGSHSGISDENDFAAVAARETIQSDAERIAQNRAQYTVIPPAPLPPRSDDGPNIVQFAISTNHAPGTPMYKRSALRLTNPGSACAKYASPDQAQEAFLAGGGPDRDRKGLDPDGDGFACGWDPRPFRSALQ